MGQMVRQTDMQDAKCGQQHSCIINWTKLDLVIILINNTHIHTFGFCLQ